MKWLIFDTIEEANQREQEIWNEINPIIETRNGVYQEEKITQKWAIPRETLDGKWVIPSHNDTGIDYDESWFPVDDLT